MRDEVMLELLEGLCASVAGLVTTATKVRQATRLTIDGVAVRLNDRAIPTRPVTARTVRVR